VIFEYAFFTLSFIACCFIIYITAMLWFTNERTSNVRSFMYFGITICLWIFFSGVMVIVDEGYFTFIYTMHYVMAVFFPYSFLWYSLQFSESKLIHLKPVALTILIIPIIDAIVAATNPWHSLMFTGYENYPNLVTGPLFSIHAVLAYIAVFFGLIVNFIYVFKQVRKTPIMIIAAFSILVPYIINIIFSLGIVRIKWDLTAVGFMLTYALFFLASYKSGVFSFKSLAMAKTFESLTDLMVIVNSQGVVVDTNKSFDDSFKEFSITTGDTHIASFLKWLYIRTEACYPDNLLLNLDNHSIPTQSGEFRVSGINNSDKMCTFTFSVDSIYSGKNVSGYVIVMADVSRYREMINEIDEQNKTLVELKELAEQASVTKGMFLANMSHELRTPINAITGMTTIARNSNDPKRVNDCLNKVDAASRQLLGIINDILDISKIEANKMELASEPFSLRGVIDNVKSIIEVRVAERKQNFHVEVSDDLPDTVTGDDVRLTQILLNLLSNAVKFTPENGNISLSAKLIDTKDDMYYIETKVKDDGIGISEEQQSRLFRSFEQADKGTSKRYGGTGLGLAITKSIAELMGGGIELESKSGQGSCFTVTFCVKAGGEIIADEEKDENYDFNGRKILLVEDVEINSEILMAMFEDSGVLIDCAKNGLEAVDMFKADSLKYDIIFMDIQMPVMDGYTAAEIIRGSGLPNADTIPILAMTANAFSEDVAKAKEVGMNDHIAKPIDYDLLNKKINHLMSNYR
jgi:Signal transduction histidine kinase